MGTQNNRLNETVLLSTQNICLELWVRKYLQDSAEFFCLSKPVCHTYGNVSRVCPGKEKQVINLCIQVGSVIIAAK